MKVTVGTDKCIASGQCVLTSPEVFDQRDEDGVVVLLNPSPSAELTEGSSRPPCCAPPWPSPSKTDSCSVES
jgi:ferredoxin